jgi:hypothetical protein
MHLKIYDYLRSVLQCCDVLEAFRIGTRASTVRQFTSTPHSQLLSAVQHFVKSAVSKYPVLRGSVQKMPTGSITFLDFLPINSPIAPLLFQDDCFSGNLRQCRSTQNLQIGIVAMRDVIQADVLVVTPEADSGIVEFLRRIAVSLEEQKWINTGRG